MLLMIRISKLLFSLALVTTLGCAHEARQASVSDTSRATAKSGGGEYIVIDFEKGRSSLSNLDREKLNRLNRIADDEGRKINEISVLAWADREYPHEGSKATKQDILLADDRAEMIKKYLKDELHTNVNVDNQNMAERPGFFSEMMKTDSYKTKTVFEQTGAAPTQSQLTGNKSSKAVIFIKYE